MGNASGLPYDILDQVDYRSNNHWQLSKGAQKVLFKCIGSGLNLKTNNCVIFDRREASKECLFFDLSKLVEQIGCHSRNERFKNFAQSGNNQS